MKRKDNFITAALLVAVTAIITTGLMTQETEEQLGKDKVYATFQTGNREAWAVLEVANNETEKTEGLMNVTELGKHEGMLFNYTEEDLRAFWMKNTLIPLDIIFLNENREVINVETAYPEPNTSEQELKRYRSEEPAKYVIEVKAGFTENKSIKKGTEITWRK
jgi:uncharacterized membrane protein (UPF0127 family)